MFDYALISDEVTFEGEAAGDVVEMLAEAPRLEYTTAAASALTVTTIDPDGDLTTRLPGLQATLTGGAAWELAGVRRGINGRTQLLFEDTVVARLRAARHQASIPAGSTTLTELVTRLASLAGVPVTLDPTRRTLTAAVTLSGPVWRSVTGLADTHGLWRYSTGDRLVVASPEWLLATDADTVLDEDGDTLDTVAFTLDVGRTHEVAAAEVTDWQPALGEVTELTGLGPASGKWVVTSYVTTVGDDTGRVTWTRPATGRNPWS